MCWKVYPVVVGPLTAVVGRTVDVDNNVIPNAAVNVLDEFYAVSGTDGRFSIPNVPAAMGTLRVKGQAQVSTGFIQGKSLVVPTQANGLTDVGNVVFFGTELENRYPCLKIDSPAGADEDPDSDGQTNLIEYHNGTNLCEPNLPPGQRQTISAEFSLRNGVPVTWLEPGQYEVSSAEFSLRNGIPDTTLPSGQFEAFSTEFSVLVSGGISPLPEGQNEAYSAEFSVNNGSLSTTLPVGLSEVSSSEFSLLNGVPSSIMPAGWNEVSSAEFSLRNGDIVSSLQAGLSETFSSQFSIRTSSGQPQSLSKAVSGNGATSPDPPSPLALQGGVRDGLFVGETVTLTASAPGASSVEFLMDGTSADVRTSAPFIFTFTVPAGVPSLQIRAIGRDASGQGISSGERTFTIVGESGRSITARLRDQAGKSMSRVRASLLFNGLNAEFFDFVEPIVELPDLQGRKPAMVRAASGLALRNPERVFGFDPFGSGMAPDFAVRLRGWIQLAGTGEHSFRLRSHNGARLSIDGREVVDIPGGSTFSLERTGESTLSEGLHAIEIVYFATVSGSELILSHAEPGGPLQTVPLSMLWMEGPATEASRGGEVIFSSLPSWVNRVFIRSGESASELIPLPDGDSPSSVSLGNVVLKPRGIDFMEVIR